MRFNWLLLSFFSIFLFCSPAEAGKLLSWQFESKENRLVFTTDDDVQPKAQLLARPTRLVIDLPKTNLGRETVKERYSGAIRSLRVGQFDEQTARIVVELAPGYTLDPQEVQFRNTSSTQWSVDLPTPQIEPLSRSLARLEADKSTRERVIIPVNPQPLTSTRPLPRIDSTRPFPRIDSNRPFPRIDSDSRDRVVDTLPSPSEPINSQPAVVENTSVINSSPYVKPTRNGFFIGIDGNRNNQVSAQRSGSRIDFDLEGVTLPSALAAKTVAVNQYGVNQIEFTQTSPTQARMSLRVDSSSPDWNASFSRIRGLVLVPREGLSSTLARSQERPFPSSRLIGNTTTIEKIELVEDDTQLLIHANRPVTAQNQYDSNGAYEIIIPNAELATSSVFQGPDLNARSPISEVRVRQEDTSVVVEVQTRLGIRLGKIEQQDNELIAFPISRGWTPPSSRSSPLLSPDYRSLSRDFPRLENRTLSTRPLPSSPVSHNKPLVIIDPGHGGQDPGTIGIGGVREKDIILPISLDVAEGLRKQGIEVKITRDSDYFVSLKGRTEFANKVNADLFVSIHANAINLSRPDVNGLETYYYQDGRRLAEVIHWSILNSVNIKDRGIRRARFYVLRHSEMPAVLVEVGFVTGAEDAPRLKDPAHRSQMADAIIRGIIEYVKQKGL